MKKVLLSLLLMLLIVSISTAEDIACTQGYCDGWTVSYESNSSSSLARPAKFKFVNNTGVSAFKVKASINFYDSFGHQVGRVTKNAGTINSFWHVEFRDMIPANTSKMFAEVYWTDVYEDSSRD